MKITLTSKESKKICNEFNLGKYQTIKPIKGGLINHNFDLRTDKGNFIVRILGKSLNDSKKKRLKEEFRVLKFLKTKKFPYEIPSPIKSNRGKFLFKINNKNLWIYSKIYGTTPKKTNEKHIKEVAKALAIYHKTMKDFKSDKKNDEEGFIYWVKNDFKKLKEINSKDQTSNLIKENFELLDSSIKFFSKKRSRTNIMPIHRDLTIDNVLFKKDILVGILDFDNLETHPIVYDIATSIKGTCFIKGRLDKKRLKVFKDSYRKINRISKKEEDLIIYYILRELDALIIWYYFQLKKAEDKKGSFIGYALIQIKNLIKDFNLK